MKPLGKPALTRCQYQRTGKGCAVYHKPEKGFPWECGLWSCVWLTNPHNDAAAMRRPDRSHYVIDIMPDFVTQEMSDGQQRKIPVVQIWADAKFPDAHRDPELRAWLERRKGFCGLVRYGNDHGLLLVPPHMNDTSEWTEKRTDQREENHTFGQVLQVLGAA